MNIAMSQERERVTTIAVKRAINIKRKATQKIMDIKIKQRGPILYREQ